MKLTKAFPFLAMISVLLVGSCKKDDVSGVRPVVNSTNPIKDATGVSVKAKITASFSAAMDPSTITTSSFIIQKGTETVPGAVTYAGTTATFTPTANLAANSVFTGTITMASKDAVGTSLARDYIWSFTSGEAPDVALPTVGVTDPLNNATGVALNKVITAVFSEAMNPSTINASTFTLKQGATSIAGTVTYAGTTATFTPSAPLIGATYTATITTGAKDLAGNALAANVAWNFAAVSIPDTTLPVVSSTSPINTSVGVALNTVVSLSFSEVMNSTTISGSTFTLKQGATAIAGTVAYSGTTATFTPATILATNTIYTATITTGAMDLAGNALAANTVWTFTTSNLPDLIPPVVSSTDPLNATLGVALSKVVTIVFNEAMDPLTITASTFTLKQGATVIAGTVAYSGTTATFTPSAPLTSGATYTATISTAAKDLAGNALAFNTVWTFDTADTIPPVVNATDPLTGATGLAANKVLTINFNEAMNATTINTTTFTLSQGSTPVVGIVTYSGTTATFTPSSPLASSTTYTATITTGAKDLAGNALAAPIVWTFTTADFLAPTVTLTDPLNSATGVALNKVIGATFSEAMNASTISASTFTLVQGSTPISGIVAYSGTTATFTPSAPLSALLVYTATITTGAKDVAGNAIAANKVWSFTTVTNVALGPAIVNLGTAANFVMLAKTGISTTGTTLITGDIGVSPIGAVALTGFSQILDASNQFSTSVYVNPPGKLYAANYAVPTPSNLGTAVGDMETAYTDAATRPTPDFLNLLTGNIGGQTLAPGLYKWTTNVSAATNFTISGGPNDVWIFQVDQNLSLATGVNIQLAGGALPQNIFWQVAGSVTLGGSSHFEGIILCMTGIDYLASASMNGRALSQTAITLISNTVVKP